MGRFDEAIEQARKALELDPSLAEAHNNLAAALAARGRVDEAIEHFRRALALDPAYAEAYNNLGAALAGRGLLDAAIAHYRKALEIDPAYAEAQNNLGACLGGTLASPGLRPAARGLFDEAIALPEGLGNQARLCRGPL